MCFSLSAVVAVCHPSPPHRKAAAMGAKLFFYYSAMNAGKSATLLQANHNYNERGMGTKLFIPTMIGTPNIASRIGLSAPAIQFEADFDFFEYMKAHQERASTSAVEEVVQSCACVLVDEAQFLTQTQVRQLTRICDELQIPTLCYGLRSDFVGEPFEGSKYLLAWADNLTEIKTICSCGRKATMNQRVSADGKAVAEGEQVQVGGNERYIGKCRAHFWEGIEEAAARVAAASGTKPLHTPRAEESASTPEKTSSSKVRPAVEEADREDPMPKLTLPCDERGALSNVM